MCEINYAIIDYVRVCNTLDLHDYISLEYSLIEIVLNVDLGRPKSGDTLPVRRLGRNATPCLADGCRREAAAASEVRLLEWQVRLQTLPKWFTWGGGRNENG